MKPSRFSQNVLTANAIMDDGDHFLNVFLVKFCCFCGNNWNLFVLLWCDEALSINALEQNRTDCTGMLLPRRQWQNGYSDHCLNEWAGSKHV